jgi:hypothetical protein
LKEARRFEDERIEDLRKREIQGRDLTKSTCHRVYVVTKKALGRTNPVQPLRLTRAENIGAVTMLLENDGLGEMLAQVRNLQV